MRGVQLPSRHCSRILVLHCQAPVAQGRLELLHAGEAAVGGSLETVQEPVLSAMRTTVSSVVVASELGLEPGPGLVPFVSAQAGAVAVMVARLSLPSRLPEAFVSKS
jgi:hypothetical protein